MKDKALFAVQHTTKTHNINHCFNFGHSYIEKERCAEKKCYIKKNFSLQFEKYNLCEVFWNLFKGLALYPKKINDIFSRKIQIFGIFAGW